MNTGKLPSYVDFATSPRVINRGPTGGPPAFGRMSCTDVALTYNWMKATGTEFKALSNDTTGGRAKQTGIDVEDSISVVWPLAAMAFKSSFNGMLQNIATA